MLACGCASASRGCGAALVPTRADAARISNQQGVCASGACGARRLPFQPAGCLRQRGRRRALRWRHTCCVRRREETGSGRLRNGLLGLVATVALVAAAWQAWGAEQNAGPVSLLQIELGTGSAKIVPSRDPKSLITAEVHGLSNVRQKLGSALGSLKRAKKFAGPPAPQQQVRCSRREWQALRCSCSVLSRLARVCIRAYPSPLRCPVC